MALPTASDNPFTSLLITEGTEPTAPAAGKQRLYVDSTSHKLMLTNSSGTELVIGPGGAAAIATDTIWDAAGDLVVGSGADTAAKLAKGSAGGALSIINSAVAWNSGTSFPASKATGDRYWRTDLQGVWFWDGTQWLSETPHEVSFPQANGAMPASASAVLHRLHMPGALGGSDVYLASVLGSYYVSGGTALSGSHKWVGTVSKTGGVTSTSLGTITINSGASDQWFGMTTLTINAVATVASFAALEINWIKTGTPGSLYANCNLAYRTIAT